MLRTALPEARAGAESGQQYGGGVGPALHDGRGGGRCFGLRGHLGGHLFPGSGEPPGPGAYASFAGAAGGRALPAVGLGRLRGAVLDLGGPGVHGVALTRLAGGAGGAGGVVLARVVLGGDAGRSALRAGGTRVRAVGGRTGGRTVRCLSGRIRATRQMLDPAGARGTARARPVPGGAARRAVSVPPAVRGRPGIRRPGVVHPGAVHTVRVRGSRRAGAVPTRQVRTLRHVDAAHPQMPLAVRGRRQRRSAVAGGEAERRFAQAQQRTRGQPHRSGTDRGAVQRRAVRRAQVRHGDPAVLRHRHRAVQPGDVGVVQRHVCLRRAADADAAAVEEVHTARVGAGHDLELRRGVRHGRLVVAGDLEREHSTVHQGRLAEGAALGVEALLARVENDGARDVRARDGGREIGGDGGERRPGRRGDQHVARARGRDTSRRRGPRGRGLPAARCENGQPDLHGRQQSLLRRVPGRGAACDRPHPAGRHGPQSSRPHGAVLRASSHLPLTTRPGTAHK